MKNAVENECNDFPFALALFLSLTTPDEISKDGASDNVLDFILGKIVIFYGLKIE